MSSGQRQGVDNWARKWSLGLFGFSFYACHTRDDVQPIERCALAVVATKCNIFSSLKRVSMKRMPV